MIGVKAEVLAAIVDFMYNGEVKVHQQYLESFLALAQEIRLEGLSKKKGYFQFEKGKQTTDQPLPVKDINETGSYLDEDDIGSVDNNVQKLPSENKETKSESSNSFLQEHFVSKERHDALEIEIDYEDLETVLPFSKNIEVESTQRTDNHVQGAATNEKEFPLPEDEKGLFGKAKYTVNEYTDLPSKKNIQSLPKLKDLDFEEELTISENKIELCETTQKPIHEYTEDNTKTNIPSFTHKQDVTSPSDLLTPKISLSPDISKEQLDKRIDELMEKIDADKNIWLCTVCLRTSRGTSAMYTLRRHIETHFEGLSYPCEHCEHRSKSKNALSNHRFTQHKEEANLKRINEKENRELHGGNKHISCKYCPYTCQKFSRLKAHTKRHTEEKTYICSICKMSFARSIGLKKHSITHEEDTVDPIVKEYRVLDEKIESMMFIGDNMTLDGRRKATVCKMCGKEDYPSVIKKHMETNHLEVYFPCDVCNKVFRSRASLRIHTSRRH